MMFDYPKTIKLPSGKIARLTRGIKVRDTVVARRVVNPADIENPVAISLAALAPTVEIDGKPTLYEDLLELDLDDMMELSETVEMEKKASRGESI